MKKTAYLLIAMLAISVNSIAQQVQPTEENNRLRTIIVNLHIKLMPGASSENVTPAETTTTDSMFSYSFDDLKTNYRLGTENYDQKNYIEAEKYLLRALEINVLNQRLLNDSQNVYIYGSLSDSYLYTKEYEKAEQSAIKGLSIDDTKVYIKANLATAMLLQGRYKEAEKIFLELKGKTCFDSDGRTCVEAWLDDFERLEKADAISENQRENVEKIRQLLSK